MTKRRNFVLKAADKMIEVEKPERLLIQMRKAVKDDKSEVIHMVGWIQKELMPLEQTYRKKTW